MTIIDKLKNKESKKDENVKREPVGFNAILEECRNAYPDQLYPIHYGPMISWEAGGKFPLREVNVYETDEYYHFVSFGLSDLFEKTSDDEYSGYGMEFTFKLKKDKYEDLEAEIRCVCNILQQVARITFTKDEIFDIYEYIYTGQTDGIDAFRKSKLTGLITIPDTTFVSLDTPNGRVDFVEFIGVTNDELLALENKKTTVANLYKKIGSDITDYNRKSVF